MTHNEFYAFCAQLEFYMIEVMKAYGEQSKAAFELGDEQEASSLAVVTIALDEMRKCIISSFRDTWGIHFAESSNGRIPGFEPGDGGSTPPSATSRLN